jgi:hypothetical protein
LDHLETINVASKQQSQEVRNIDCNDFIGLGFSARHSCHCIGLHISRPKLELQSFKQELHDCPENVDGIQRETQVLNKGDHLPNLRELDTMSEIFIEFQVSCSLPLYLYNCLRKLSIIYNLELREKDDV